MRHGLLLLIAICSGTGVMAQDSLSVLFIGNSYTYVNDLPQVTRQLAESMGKQLTVGSKTNGGYTFQAHWNDPQTYVAMNQQSWDVVVLQGQSQEPSFPYEQVNSATIPFARRLSDSVYARNACSEVLYYMTWGRENGDPQWDSISTFEGMNRRLYDTYMRMADSSDAMVAAVGGVWKYMRDTHPDVQLYAGDGSHPSMAGTYLAACTFFTSLFRESVTGATYVAGLDAQTAGWIQHAADLVVLDSLEHFRLHAISRPVQATFEYVQSGNEVQFENTTQNGEMYTWDFGDGTFSQAENPAHNWFANGSYAVQLISSNSCSSDTAMHVIQINSLSTSNPAKPSFQIVEFADHFEVHSEARTIYYEISTFDGKIIISDKILTFDTFDIEKTIPKGVLVLKNELNQEMTKTFIKW